MIATMHISNVIAELKSSHGQTQRIQFVYAQGKKQGQLGEIEGYYSTGKSVAKAVTSKQPRMNAIWKQDGTIPIFDIKENKMKTLKISHLRMYNGYLIKH